MSLYSAIQFTSVSFLYASASNLGDLQASLGGTNSAASSHELMTVQYLFIDLFLILPIAIFSKFVHCQVRHSCLLPLSGMDGSISGLEPEKTDCESRFAQGSYPSSGTNTPLYPHTKCCLHIRATARLVSHERFACANAAAG